MIRIILVVLCLFVLNSVFAVQKGGVKYSETIDYSKLNKKAISAEAETLFNKYKNTADENEKRKILNSLLSNYIILGEIDKENPYYFAQIGFVYGKLEKNRLAKSNFFRCCSLNGNYPYGHYMFGEYYFDRQQYRKALNEYKKAYNSGYSNNYDNLYKMGIIYEKFGDYLYASKYFKQASIYKNSPELQAKIKLMEELLEANPLYNLKKRLEQTE